MKILVINCGSSSLKYQLFNMADQTVLAKGLAERIGIPGSTLTHQHDGEKKVFEQDLPSHREAISMVLNVLADPEHGVISSLSEIRAVGHRVLHGGEKFTASCLVDDDVMKAVYECVELGPLHNPANIMGIEACQKLMPGTPNVAVFDTAFHQTMPPAAYIYGLPYEYYEKYGIRRYGFHGTSHRYVTMRAVEMLEKMGIARDESKIITCHLGNGSSLAAVKSGKVIDTSMGLTPLEGLVMGTRCGSIDPAIIPLLMKKEGFTPDQVDTVMNKKSGVMGVSGISSDFRDLQAAAEKNYRARLAIDVFIHSVIKTVGSFAAVLNGVDAIVFTAGIGENAAWMREAIVKNLSYLGAEIDPEKNKVRGEEIDIATAESKTRLLIIPTDEELMIAKDTAEIVGEA
ncbi:MAG TPA: acetate kinase [Desulfobacteria bacterium]|nr:acetate kinase [Desulfobacteria bacterium]